ncbi:hypothetical protein LUQ84_003162 [Hamiltosporidium tvaerminnensis]|nr:hypothetical protein LUQ84_003162 [Hamiltosporidium tvaerminnensis]
MQENLSTLKIKSLKKNLREFNSNLSNVIEFLETLIPKNESLNVYEKKNTIYENKRTFRKKKRMLKFFRGRFYRGLYERVESNHVVSSCGIVSFWPTMSDKNDDTVPYDD